MDFELVFNSLIQKFKEKNVDHVLIGGFALNAAGYTRATKDIDFLITKEAVSVVKEIMSSLGYQLIHESDDVSNYWAEAKPLGSVDFLHAHRKYTKKMMERAQSKRILNGQYYVKVVTCEDMIGLKVQSSSNDESRYHQDMADVEALINANRENLNIELVKEYFDLFDRGKEFQEILEKM